MQFFDTIFWQNFVSNGIATLLGVGAGIPIAIWINNFLEKSNEKEHKRKILQLLYDELIYNHKILTSWLNNESKKEDMEVLSLELKHEVWSAFSDGGEIQWIKDPSLLGKLALVFSDIKVLRSWAEWSMISHNYSETVTQQVRDGMWKRLNEKSEMCINSINETIGVLKSII